MIIELRKDIEYFSESVPAVCGESISSIFRLTLCFENTDAGYTQCIKMAAKIIADEMKKLDVDEWGRSHE